MSQRLFIIFNLITRKENYVILKIAWVEIVTQSNPNY